MQQKLNISISVLYTSITLVSATSWSLVQRSPTECGESKKCDREV
jgi:hypothetical protein